MDYKKLFNDRLKILMKEKNLTVSQLSKAITCDYKSIVRWCCGQCFPRILFLKKLANYFDCSVDYLLGLNDCKNFKNRTFKGLKEINNPK